MPALWSPDFFWRIFERTGSVLAYLMYRRSLAGGRRLGRRPTGRWLPASNR